MKPEIQELPVFDTDHTTVLRKTFVVVRGGRVVFEGNLQACLRKTREDR